MKRNKTLPSINSECSRQCCPQAFHEGIPFLRCHYPLFLPHINISLIKYQFTPTTKQHIRKHQITPKKKKINFVIKKKSQNWLILNA